MSFLSFLGIRPDRRATPVRQTAMVQLAHGEANLGHYVVRQEGISARRWAATKRIMREHDHRWIECEIEVTPK